MFSSKIYFFKFSIVGRARASFRQSFRFGSMNMRDRGLRLAGYLTPPSDITQDDDDGHHNDRLGHTANLRQLGTSELKVQKPPWTQLSAPALTIASNAGKQESCKTGTTFVADEIRINVPIINKVIMTINYFDQEIKIYTVKLRYKITDLRLFLLL